MMKLSIPGKQIINFEIPGMITDPCRLILTDQKQKRKMDNHEKVTGWKTAYRFFIFDTFVNWALGILFIFFFRYVETFISNEKILPDYFWIISGVGLLLFGFWQTYILITRSFTANARMFSCILAWLPCIPLTYALLFMGFPIRPLAGIFIWFGNVYMFTLGVLYLISWYKSKNKHHEEK